MRNLRKLTAAVLAIALVLTTMTAAFAADPATVVNADKAATLKSLDLYAGQDDSDPAIGLEDALTTQDSLIFLAKLFGYSDAAADLTADEVTEGLAKFDDAASISDYAKNVVAYSAINGILSGSTKDGKFFVGAKDTVTAARFATFILKQMGYVVPLFTESAAQLSEVEGSAVSADEAGALTRDVAVGIMYGALTAEKADGETVIAGIVGSEGDLYDIAVKVGLIVPPTPKTLEVSSVKATNLRTVVVEFNRALTDEDEAEDEKNYSIDGSKVYEATLSEDAKTVTLLTAADDAMENYDTDVEVDIDKEVGLDADKTVEIDPKDTTIPTVVSVTATGPKTVKVILSEALNIDDDDNNETALDDIDSEVEIDDGLVAIDTDECGIEGTELTLHLTTALDEGDHTITFSDIDADDGGLLVDNAGYALEETSSEFTFVKDTSPLSVSITDSDETSVDLTFNKPIDEDSFIGNSNVLIRHTYNTDTNEIAGDENLKDSDDNEISDKPAIESDDSQTFTVTFDKDEPLPPGETKLFIVYDDEDDDAIIDDYGEALGETTLTVTTATDTEKPTADVEYDDTNRVLVNFSEDVQSGTGDSDSADYKSNYTLKDSDGDSIAIKQAFYEEVLDGNSAGIDDEELDDYQVLLYTAEKMNGGSYTLTIKNVRDDSVAENKMETVTLTFTGDDDVAPEVDSVSRLDDNKIKIEFSEAMDPDSVRDLDNYQYLVTNAATATGSESGWTDLDDDYDIDGNNTSDTITMADSNESVIIEIDEDEESNLTPNGENLFIKIARVSDVAGNDSEAYSEIQEVGNADAIGLDSYEVLDEDSVKLVIDDSIYGVNKSDFRLTTDGTHYYTPAKASVSHEDGDTYITLDINAAQTITSTTGAGIDVYTVGSVPTGTAYTGAGNTSGSKNEYDTPLCFDTTLKTEAEDGNLNYDDDGLFAITDSYAAKLILYRDLDNDDEYDAATNDGDGILESGEEVAFTYMKQNDADDDSDEQCLKSVTLYYSEDLYASSVDDDDYEVSGYDIDHVSVDGNKVTIYVDAIDYGDYDLNSSISVQQVGEVEDETNQNVTEDQDEVSMDYGESILSSSATH